MSDLHSDLESNLKTDSARVALVTGAAKRLGRAVALRLATEGADIVVHYGSSQNEAQETVQDVEKLGRRAVAIPADLAKIEEIRNLFEQANKHFGRLDVLVNCAANFIETKFTQTSEAEWD